MHKNVKRIYVNINIETVQHLKVLEAVLVSFTTEAKNYTEIVSDIVEFSVLITFKLLNIQ